MGKQPGEFFAASKQARTKQNARRGFWLESHARKAEREKMKEGRQRPVGLDEPSGLTVGPYLIGRPVSAWMTTKQN